MSSMCDTTSGQAVSGPLRRLFAGTVMAVAIAMVLALQWRAHAQAAFVDDAGRRVDVPARIDRVFAAGAPAEVLIYTLAPDRLVARNRLPDAVGAEFFPEAYRSPVLVRQLPEVDNPAFDAEMRALRPDLYVDYGTIDSDYVQSLEAVSRRTGVPGVILDGSLSQIPAVYRRLGAMLGIPARGERLAVHAEQLLSASRGVLAQGPRPVRVYLACSADGTLPCPVAGATGEQLTWLGAVNVAPERQTAAGRLTPDDVRALAPDAMVVTGFGNAAVSLRADPAWRVVPAVAAGRIYQAPAHPYSWGARPPSVNRLLGLPWLASVLRQRTFDAEFFALVRRYFADFYHFQPTDQQIQRLLAGPA